MFEQPGSNFTSPEIAAFIAVRKAITPALPIASSI
jgi:hypothetical protein